MTTLTIKHFYCSETSDGYGKDEIEFHYKSDGNTYMKGWSGLFSDNSGHRDMNIRYNFNSTLSLKIMEYDDGMHDDMLGFINFDQSQAGSGEHVYSFFGHGCHYDLTWYVS